MTRYIITLLVAIATYCIVLPGCEGGGGGSDATLPNDEFCRLPENANDSACDHTNPAPGRP